MICPPIIPLLLAMGAPDDRGVDRVLIDRELTERTVEVLRLGDGTIVYDDARGLRRREPTELYLAVIDPKSRARSVGDTGVLELVTGERLLGRIAAHQRFESDDETGDAVWWRRPGRDAVRVPLEQIDRIVLDTEADPPADQGDDAVLLRNDDLLIGFVERIGGMVAIDAGGGLVETPVDAVAVIDLANPDEPATGTIAWLSDGSVLALAELAAIDNGVLGFRTVRAEPTSEQTEAPDATLESAPLTDIAGVLFDAGAWRPLGAIEPESQEPGAGRRWTEPVRVETERPLGLSDLEIPGPMRVRWVLPAGASRFAATAELPRAFRSWGDCELIVSIETSAGVRELARHRLNAETPSVRINTPLPGAGEGRRRLVLTLDAGAFGPIQDRVVLRRPVLVVE